MEARRKLGAQAEQLRETTATRDRLTSKLEAEQLKYDKLKRTSLEERATALAIEKSLGEHCDQMNSKWKGWVFRLGTLLFIAHVLVIAK